MFPSTVNSVISKVSPSGSVSFVSINPFAVVTVKVTPSMVVPESSTAIGSSFTELTVMFTVAVDISPSASAMV